MIKQLNQTFTTNFSLEDLSVTIDKTEKLITKYEYLINVIIDEVFSKGVNDYSELRSTDSKWNKVNLSKIIHKFKYLPENITNQQKLFKNSVEILEDQYLLPTYLLLYLQYAVDKPSIFQSLQDNPALKNIRIPIIPITEQYLIVNKLSVLISKIDIEKKLLNKYKAIEYYINSSSPK